MTNDDTIPRVTGIILEEQTQLTLSEISRGCAVHAECIIELVEEGVLAPVGAHPRQWRFDGTHLRRATIALHLQQDLGINLAGVALALQLLDEVNALRARLKTIGRE